MLNKYTADWGSVNCLWKGEGGREGGSEGGREGGREVGRVGGR